LKEVRYNKNMIKKILQFITRFFPTSGKRSAEKPVDPFEKLAIAGKQFKKPKRKVNKVFIHCSDSERNDDVAVIRLWHIKRGFKGIGYHFFIKRDGTIQKGRSLEMMPASQKGYNMGSISICVSGKKKFTKKSLENLKLLCISIDNVYDKITFHGHCEVDKSKTCPVFDYKKVLGLDKDGFMKHPIG
jgi:hypothetical protein